MYVLLPAGISREHILTLPQGLESNPKPILEEHLKDATKKTQGQKKD